MFSLRTFLVAIAVLLCGTSVAMALTVGPVVRVSPAGHTVAEVSAATSPVNPNLMAATVIDNDQGGRTLISQIRCAMYVSQDAGASWAESSAWPRTDQLKPLHDPWLTISADGTIHATCIADVSGRGVVAYTKSSNAGATWSPPTVLPDFNPAVGADKSVISAANDGTLHVCFRQASNLVVSRSTDQGATWTNHPTGIDAHCNGLVADSGGTITMAVAFASTGFATYGTVNSTDGGATWSQRTLGDKGGPFSDSHLPTVTRDHTGRIIIAGTDGTNIDMSVQDLSGALVQQWQLPGPPSTNCAGDRIIHPSIASAPGRLPALQVACKVRPTNNTTGRQEVWLYPVIDEPTNSAAPTLVSGITLPTVKRTPSSDSFAGRFPDGGYFWSLTWRSDGWQPMWIDPRTGPGPGELLTAAVTS